jgi:hypothetical protein
VPKQPTHKRDFRLVDFTFAFILLSGFMGLLTSEESKSFIAVTCSYSCYESMGFCDGIDGEMKVEFEGRRRNRGKDR